MRVLIITSELGRSPAGKVTENIVTGLLDQGIKMLVVCANNNSAIIKNYEILEIPYKYQLPIKLTKLLTILFHISFRNSYWKFLVFTKYNKVFSTFSPDIIFSIASGGNEEVLNLGAKLADTMNVNFAVHMLDPIPGPPGWENFEIYRKSRIHTVKNAIKRANLLSMGNEHMLAFQQSCVKFDILSKSFVIPDPVIPNEVKFSSLPTKNIFTYLGSFYGARRPDGLFQGFSEYLKSNSDCELHIYGNNSCNLDKCNISNIAKQKIKFKGFTNDLSSVFENSKVLIDVDADVKNDVFISSKLKEYLNINRPILCITGANSPSRNLLSDLKKTIFFSDHNPKNISHSIEVLMNLDYTRMDFSERNTIKDYLSINRVSSDIHKHFKRVININATIGNHR